MCQTGTGGLPEAQVIFMLKRKEVHRPKLRMWKFKKMEARPSNVEQVKNQWQDVHVENGLSRLKVWLVSESLSKVMRRQL